MKFSFDTRFSDSPFVEAIWRTHSEGGGSFISLAASQLEMVVTKQQGKTWLSVRGPETKAKPAPVPEEAEFFGIIFKMGTYMPPLSAKKLVNNEIHLPEAVSTSFWLHGSSWQFPTYENADTFIERLVRTGHLAQDDVVQGVLQDQPQAWSSRTIRRRFLHATGLTYGTIYQIERAHKAMALLQRGKSILDTVEELGYFDQPHMTRALKHLMGQTPAQIIAMSQAESGDSDY